MEQNPSLNKTPQSKTCEENPSAKTREPRPRNQEKRRSLKKTLSKLKENQNPAGSGAVRKKSQMKTAIENVSPLKTTKITDFFNRKQNSKKRSKKGSSSAFRQIENSNNKSAQKLLAESSNFIRNTKKNSSSCDAKREVLLENLKLKEEIRKLNKKLVDQDIVIESNQIKADNLVIVNHGQKEMLENAYQFEKKLECNGREIIRKVLIEKEEYNRKEKMKLFLDLSMKIGKEVSIKSAGKEIKQWIDGHELSKLRKTLEITKELIKQEIEAIKAQPQAKKSENGPESTKQNSMTIKRFSLSVKDAKSSLNAQLHFLTQETAKIEQEINKLEDQQETLRQMSRLLNEEESCYFAKLHYPLLNSRYQVLSYLGKGRFGETYKAYDLKKLREVALKLRFYEEEMPKETEIRNLFEQFRGIKHHFIVKMLDFFKHSENTMVYVVEYCDGGDLRSLISASRVPVSDKEFRYIVKQVLFALAALHEKGLVHGNLKPRNIFFHEGSIKIGDFWLEREGRDTWGSSVEEEDIYYKRGDILGDDRGAIIESNRGATVDNNKGAIIGDLWALGVICYELLVKEKPDLKEVRFPGRNEAAREAKELVYRLLEGKITVKQALEMGYLAKC